MLGDRSFLERVHGQILSPGASGVPAAGERPARPGGDTAAGRLTLVPALRLAMAQLDLVVGDLAANVDRITEALATAEDGGGGPLPVPRAGRHRAIRPRTSS